MPSRMNRWIVVMAIVVVAILLIQLNRGAIDASNKSVAVGKPSPQLDLIDLESGSPLDATASNKVTLLHFWGTWCGPCRMEYPHLAEATKALSANPNFQFLPVSSESDPDETVTGLAAKTNKYFASEGITSPALADPRGITRRSAAERLEQPSLFYPTSMLIGPDGKIIGVWEGYSPDAVDQIAAKSNELLTLSDAGRH